MSRAMNVQLPEAEVVALCAKAEVEISAIETLASGGTHVVAVTPDGGAVMRRIFAKHLITGQVKRFAFMHPRPAPLTH
ncbi:hypothetical protein WG901_08835 [Novosphingobium sp. PS1R-30]|uniref:Uncharacterized protein n=2 Tax=Novosphingobium anseongense TaxID=3133436 RepID=A0ABU8RUI5_9SPHN|nr:MAG: hypothetical protein EOO76_19960 [Novosphingobium sp.]